jgi:AraC-like DNA-binding protein
MLVSAAPGALLWPAAMIVWGPGYASSSHAHHCVQLVMALQGTLRIRAGSGERWATCGAALVRPDAKHEVEVRDTTALIAFVEPESDLGAALLERVGKDITRIPPGDVARWRAMLGELEAVDTSHVETWVRGELLRGRKAPRMHPRIKRALGHVRAQLGAEDALSLPRLAEVAGLSPSRFMHVFTESVGVPLRPYLLWLRLQRACGELVRGAGLTDAAHRTGFSDGAHMTRTFRRMLGTTPSEIVRRRQPGRATFVRD